MLLTCTNCQNSIVIDDQVYAQQGGAICEQCHQPMMPVQDNGYGQQWQQPAAGQWGQQPMAGQWNHPGMDAQWGQQNGQWSQQGMGGQWGQQPMDAQWGQQQPAMDAQWGQQNGQWNQQGMGGQWGQQPMDAQWGQQAAGGQWGQQPMDAQWGQQPPMDAQWGQQPAGSQWGGEEQWDQLADKPMETQVFDEAVDAPVIHNDNNERTMALDVWNGDGFGESLPLVPPVPASASNDAQDDGWGGAWQKPNTEDLPTASAHVVSANPGAVVVGKPMDAGASDRPTREIDAKAVQELYGDKINPITEFFKSIPLRYLIIAGAVTACAFIFFGIGVWIISQPEEKEKVFDEKGDIVTDVNAFKERTFEDIVKASKDLSPNFMPFDGPDAREGSIVAVSEEIGIVYNEKPIAKYNEFENGDLLIEKLYLAIKDDTDNINKPVIFLFDELMPMSVVYRVMYSVGVVTPKIFFGAPTPTGITTFEIKPCEWPDYKMSTFGDKCKVVSAELKITHKDMTLRRIVGKKSLVLADDQTELTDSIIGNKVYMENIGPAFANFRGSDSPWIRISPDGDVTYGVFMNTALETRGNIDNPNMKDIYLYKVPLR